MSNNKKPALGRGVDALMGGASDLNEWKPRTPAVLPQWEGTSTIKIAFIEANPDQPRKEFDEESLQELADSIRSLGLIQPITLRKLGVERYQVISGERRLRAAKMAGLTEVPAYVRHVEDDQVLQLALVENIQRKDLDAMEIAFSFQRLMDECQFTQEQMAERVGKKRATVANYLRLVQLPAEIQLMLRTGALSMGHARALLSLDSEAKQLQLARRIVKKGLSVRQAESLTRQEVRPKTEEGPAPEDAPEEWSDSYYKVVEHLGSFFDNNVSLHRSPKGESVLTIRCANDSQMQSFLDVLDTLQK